jgi:hypothetical protein
MPSHIDCKIAAAKLNGRTLKQALLATGANHDFGNFSLTEWVEVCPKCHAYALGAEHSYPWPFLCSDGVMRTVADFNADLEKYVSHELNFIGFRFSQSALESSIGLVMMEDSTTKEVESAGSKISDRSTINEILEFSKSVCDWGRGQRVWANLLRHNTEAELAAALSDWFDVVQDATDDEEAIATGLGIKGLAVSFASKHLRMLDSSKYAVLDEVLSDGLGIALNRKGYKLFMHLLREFSVANNIKHNIATLESGLFLLVRQQVRVRSLG